MSKITAAIAGVGGWVPEDVLTNHDLEKMVDTNNEWIVTRTGISERHILKVEGAGTSYIAIKAIQDLLAKTGTSVLDIELIICCTTTPDFVFPATANIIAAEMGCINAWGYDLQAACSGFLYGLSTGAQFIVTGKHKKVLVVGADKMSSIINYQDRATCIIFGDGGGVALLEPNYDGLGIQDFQMHSDGNGAPYLHMKAGGSRKPASHETIDAKEHAVFQEGATVFKFAGTNMSDVTTKLMQRNGLTSDDLSWFVPHQANRRIIEAVAHRLNVPIEKVLINIQKYGNTTNGTLPLCLWDFEKQFKKGDKMVLSAFGGGFTWGALYMKWAY